MAQEVKFLDMFGCCAALRDKCGGLELAMVKNVVVSREKRTMDIAAGFAAPGTPSDIAMLEWRIAAEYGFTRVKITGNTPAAAPAEKKAAPPKKAAGSRGNRAQQAAKKQLTICETAIARLEADIARLDGEMAQHACDAEKLNELYRQQQDVQKQLEQELTRWEELSMQAEEQESKL